MRMSRPQPVSLDKGLCRTGIRSRTAENDTLPYPCDAEIRHRMSENLERSGYISHMLGKEISSRGENMEMCVDHQLHLVSIWLSNDEKDVAILEPVYRQYKGTKYRVAVFRSGRDREGCEGTACSNLHQAALRQECYFKGNEFGRECNDNRTKRSDWRA